MEGSKVSKKHNFVLFGITTKNLGWLKLQYRTIKNRKTRARQMMRAKTVFSQICSDFKNHEFSAQVSSARGTRRRRQNFYIFTKF